MKNEVTQRERSRFQSGSVAFAALSGAKLGRIVDIAQKDLFFRYFHDASQAGDDTRKLVMVNIFHENGFSLQDLPCRIIKDYPLLTEYKFNLVAMYKCHLQFVGLTEEQKAQLDFFITHFSHIDEWA